MRVAEQAVSHVKQGPFKPKTKEIRPDVTALAIPVDANAAVLLCEVFCRTRKSVFVIARKTLASEVHAERDQQLMCKA